MQTLAHGICGDGEASAPAPVAGAKRRALARLPWPLTPFAVLPLLLAYYASGEKNEAAAVLLRTQQQPPVLFALCILLALLHLGKALARSSNDGNSPTCTNTTSVRTRRQSLKAAADASASLRAALVRLLLDAVALVVLAQGVAFLLLLRQTGLPVTIFFVACCWNADNGALLFGSLAGPADPCARWLVPAQHRTALQALSAKKTVTGVVGALVLGSLTAVLLVAGDRRRGSEGLLPLPGHWTLWQVWALGLALAVLAQAGDLLESLVKRAAQVKVSQ